MIGGGFAGLHAALRLAAHGVDVLLSDIAMPGEDGFWSADFQRNALDASVFADTTSVMDFGLVLGAFAAAGLAGSFRPRFALSPAALASAVLGGLAMGYGARIAFGCNIGAFFSGVASTTKSVDLMTKSASCTTPSAPSRTGSCETL